jgi:hypothetical protein
MTIFDDKHSKNKSRTSAVTMDASGVSSMKPEPEELRQVLEALQAAEPLLQDTPSALFVTRRPLKQFKELGALVESFPFGSEAPLGFRLWWEGSEPKRRKWLEELKNKRVMPRRSYFALTNLPVKELGSDTYVGSVFWVLGSKDEKGRVRFSKAASGFLVLGTMANTVRHGPDSLIDLELKPAV